MQNNIDFENVVPFSSMSDIVKSQFETLNRQLNKGSKVLKNLKEQNVN